MKKPGHIFIPILFCLFAFCLHARLSAQEIKHYMFTGHTYQWYTDGSKVDPRLVELDKSVYNRIWLGGDICSEAMLKRSTLEYIDSLFRIHEPWNHYALGNHDTRNGNLEWYREITGLSLIHI